MLVTLQNEFWQAGVLPQTGASLAFGRVRAGEGWVDVLRPTAEKDYANVSKTSSFIMLPWCNRIKDAVLRFGGEEYKLEAAPDDGTARHGDVRKRPWTVVNSGDTAIEMTFDSATHERVNFPFRFAARADYRLDGRDFVWTLALTNTDTRPFPAGFGYHPYFARPAAPPQLEIPCEAMFELVDYMAVEKPVPIVPRLDFRAPRPLEGEGYNDLLTGRIGNQPVQIVCPDWSLTISADPIFKHWLLFTPPGEPSFAIEPMTNSSDGFNLHERGISEAGVFVLQPGQTANGEVRLTPL